MQVHLGGRRLHVARALLRVQRAQGGTGETLTAILGGESFGDVTDLTFLQLQLEVVAAETAEAQRLVSLALHQARVEQERAQEQRARMVSTWTEPEEVDGDLQPVPGDDLAPAA